MRESWPEKRIVAIFQPHRHSRTRDLFDEFTRAFYNTDALLLLPIYAAGEQPSEGITHQSLGEMIGKRGHNNVACFETFTEVVDRLEETLQEGDLLLTLGAGDVLKVGEMYLQRGDA